MEKPANTDVPIVDLLLRRWSPRAFSNKTIDNHTLRILLEAARWAPSASNEQPWRFVLTLRQNKESFESLAETLVPKNRQWAQHAAALIAVIARERTRHNENPNRYAWYDCGQAAAHLTVQATALGLTVHQMAGFDSEALRQSAAIPDGYVPVAVMAIGYTGEPDQLPNDLAERERAPRERLPAEEISYRGQFGQPL